MLNKIICWLLGHRISNLDVRNRAACCSRCNAKLTVSYDMAYGGTVVESAVYKDS